MTHFVTAVPQPLHIEEPDETDSAKAQNLDKPASTDTAAKN
jgi:hypothetical protein